MDPEPNHVEFEFCSYPPNHQNTTPGGAKVGWKLKSRKKIASCGLSAMKRHQVPSMTPKKASQKETQAKSFEAS